MTDILTLDRVSKAFTTRNLRVEAVRRIDLRVQEHEFVTVVVDGQLVVRERRVLTVDEERVKAECQERGERILRDIGGG